jgi:hypothetical protein
LALNDVFALAEQQHKEFVAGKASAAMHNRERLNAD